MATTRKPAKKPVPRARVAAPSKADAERRRTDRNTRARERTLLAKNDHHFGLHAALGMPELRIEPPAALLDCPPPGIEEALVALWRQDGWARYAGGALFTVDPTADWPGISGALVFARTAFADLFLLTAGQVSCLDVRQGRRLELGPGAHLFLNSTLGMSDFRKSFLSQDRLFEKVRARLGDLGPHECYGLAPRRVRSEGAYDPKRYQRVDLREYLAANLAGV
jgi:hypothetical protein